MQRSKIVTLHWDVIVQLQGRRHWATHWEMRGRRRLVGWGKADEIRSHLRPSSRWRIPANDITNLRVSLQTSAFCVSRNFARPRGTTCKILWNAKKNRAGKNERRCWQQLHRCNHNTCAMSFYDFLLKCTIWCEINFCKSPPELNFGKENVNATRKNDTIVIS